MHDLNTEKCINFSQTQKSLCTKFKHKIMVIIVKIVSDKLQVF